MIKTLLILLMVFSFVSGNNALADKYVGDKSSSSPAIGFDQVDHAPWNALLQKFVNNRGMVNYKGWQSSKSDSSALDAYLKHLSSAQPKTKSSRKAKLAFWINAYNALTIKGILQVYPTKSIRDHTPKVFGFNIWEDLYIWVGGKKYNLEKIEHKILRKMGEPKIHFAIVCASIGCPRLMNEAFTAENVYKNLNRNMFHFFKQKQNFRHNAASNTFELSAILDWFKEDFGKNQAERLQKIAKYLPTEEAKAAALSGQVKVKYLEYNWKINKQ